MDTLQQDQASHVTSMDCQTKRTFTLQINSGIMKLCFVSFAVMSGSTEIDRRGPVGRVHVGLWDTSSATAVPAGQHPCMFLGRPGRGVLGRGLKRKELPVSRWRFRRGLELYRRRKGATGNGSCRRSEGSRLRRMVDTPSCLQIGQEPGLRQSRHGVRTGRRESSSHLPPTARLAFTDGSKKGFAHILFSSRSCADTGKKAAEVHTS